jgi:hypothetical protein
MQDDREIRSREGGLHLRTARSSILLQGSDDEQPGCQPPMRYVPPVPLEHTVDSTRRVSGLADNVSTQHQHTDVHDQAPLMNDHGDEIVNRTEVIDEEYELDDCKGKKHEKHRFLKWPLVEPPVKKQESVIPKHTEDSQKGKVGGVDGKADDCPSKNPKNFKYWQSPGDAEYADGSRAKFQQDLLSQPHTLLDCTTETHNLTSIDPSKKDLQQITADDPSNATIDNNNASAHPHSTLTTPQHGLEDCFSRSTVDNNFSPSPQHALSDCLNRELAGSSPLPSAERTATNSSPPEIGLRQFLGSHDHSLADCPTDESIFIYYNGRNTPQPHSLRDCVKHRKSVSKPDSDNRIEPGGYKHRLVSSTPDKAEIHEENKPDEGLKEEPAGTDGRQQSLIDRQGQEQTRRKSLEAKSNGQCDGGVANASTAAVEVLQRHFRPSLTHIPGSYRSEVFDPVSPSASEIETVSINEAAKEENGKKAKGKSKESDKKKKGKGLARFKSSEALSAKAIKGKGWQQHVLAECISADNTPMPSGDEKKLGAEDDLKGKRRASMSAAENENDDLHAPSRGTEDVDCDGGLAGGNVRNKRAGKGEIKDTISDRVSKVAEKKGWTGVGKGWKYGRKFLGPSFWDGASEP